jgi:hypothetical protein
MDRPSYSTTKRQIWFSFAFAWLVIFVIAGGGVAGVSEAVDLANIVVPSMVMLIAALLGIHRVTGSMDFRAAQERAAEDPAVTPPYDARAQPGGAQ